MQNLQGHVLRPSCFTAVNIFLLLAKFVAYAATGSKAVLASLADSAGKPHKKRNQPAACVEH